MNEVYVGHSNPMNCIVNSPPQPRNLIGSKTVRIFIVSNELLSYDTAGKRHEYFEQQIPCFSVTELSFVVYPSAFCMHVSLA